MAMPVAEPAHLYVHPKPNPFSQFKTNPSLITLEVETRTLKPALEPERRDQDMDRLRRSRRSRAPDPAIFERRRIKIEIEGEEEEGKRQRDEEDGRGRKKKVRCVPLFFLDGFSRAHSVHEH